MSSSKPLPCGPSQEGKVNTEADIWCYNCDEGLCSTCSGHHTRSKATRDHKTIDIKSYKPPIRAIKTECDKHGQQLNLYCPSHLMPCCDECISTNHSKCTGIKFLAAVVEKTKIEKSKESVEKEIYSILHVLDKMVNNKSINIQTGKQQCENIKKSFHKIREKINKHLYHLEKKLCQETDNLWDQETLTARDFITEIEKKKTNVQKLQEHLLSVTTQSSKLQSFLGVHQIEQQIHQCQQYVEDLENDDRAKEFCIKMTQKNEIKNILQQLGSLESIGEVTVVKTETGLNRESSVRRKAQVESQSNINNMTMSIETKIKINTEKGISDMICLMDGRVIVVEEDGKVNLFTSDGKLQKQLPIPGGAWSVTQINQNTIAITYPRETAIKIFNMENETVTKVINLDKHCYGLSFSNNSLAVGLNNDEIRIIDLEGNTLKSIQVESESSLFNLVYCNDRVIYSDYLGNAVYCYDESGKKIWQYTQDLSGPRGLCIDTYGNIIVADYDSDRIIVISKDGQNSKVLIGKEGGLEAPQCICFKHNESSGFICDFYGTYLATFNLVVR
ncbi:tripartite motif-containing protein 2-like [Mytilus trossulus]|uniref:tripartite motif-containing protein 2-like n=1 Tax=Mytilus trossulus TaxID=6551 RepID=UPI003005E949